MYRDCYTMKLAYPCEADGCRCGSDCLRTRPDCNRIADEDSYSNCDVIPHIGLHRSSEYMPQHDAAHVSGPEGRALHAEKCMRAYRGFRCSQDGDRIPNPSLDEQK